MRGTASSACRILARPSRTCPRLRFASSAAGNSGPCTRYTAATHPEDASSVSPAVKELLDRSAAYVLPVYARPPFVLTKGKGVHVWDTEGREYLDFCAGIAVNALGHADEGVAKVMAEEAATLLHTSNAFHHPWAGKLAELLVTLTQRDGGLGWAPGSEPGATGAKVFFANSGTEANEGALKVARLVGKVRGGDAKHELVCFAHAFHGRSLGALSVTPNAKYQKPFAPLIPGVRVGTLNVHNGLEALVTEQTAAVIVEPVQGEGGIHAAHPEWLKALRKRCDEVGAVLIYDEIQCGLYRTGTLWAHSSIPADAHPDIITMAKPLANGYPIGAVLMRDAVAQHMSVGTHGTTFGGSPLACALGHHVLSRVSAPAFVEQVRATGSHLRGRLERAAQWFPALLEPTVRGRGLILGLGFRDETHPGKVVGLARERGVLLLTAGKDAVRLVPSLNIGRAEVDKAVDVIESCLHVLQNE
ncbi:acetylornithine and succinylornithine aminotransferase [Obba rivulosa]|uniref:acetylornithine transaminase n=1 Tax=Obba rivulosa TaxID=1052685 RepID=A0A8E2DPX0_9APHY|nr:acetylornithine and succinylornithine aminotransferase [Obba rivulosa]